MMLGLHFKIGHQYINVPVGPHRIVVIALGRLDKHGRFHKRQPCFYYMHLWWCCPKRVEQHLGCPVEAVLK